MHHGRDIVKIAKMLRDLGIKKDVYKLARWFDTYLYPPLYMRDDCRNVDYDIIPGGYCDMCRMHHGSIVYHGKTKDYKFNYDY